MENFYFMDVEIYSESNEFFNWANASASNSNQEITDAEMFAQMQAALSEKHGCSINQIRVRQFSKI